MFVCVSVCAHTLTHVCMCPIPGSADAQGGLGEESAEPPQAEGHSGPTLALLPS